MVRYLPKRSVLILQHRTQAEISSHILETCYGEFLLKNHPDFEMLAPHITFIPELAYLHCNLMEVERVTKISSINNQLKDGTRKFHAFIVSGGPNHWITLLIDSFSPAKIRISIADSSFTVGLPNIVTQFIDCFTTQKSFDEFFSEAIFLGFMKEYQEEALKLIFERPDSGSVSNEKDQLGAFQSLDLSLKEVQSKIEKINMRSPRLNKLVAEMLTNLVVLRAPQVGTLNKMLFQRILDPRGHPILALPWDFMNGKFSPRNGIKAILFSLVIESKLSEKTYGNCIVARGIQTYWPNNQISLKNYQLDELPTLLLKQKHIEALNLTQNRFSDLPSIDFKSLQILDLSYNKLERVPSAVFTLFNLRALNLSGNYLTEISSEFNGLPNLVQLSFGDNKISKIDILDLPKLEQLFGSKNNISNQFWDVVNSMNLKSIEMGHNKITSITGAIKFTALRILILTNNPIEDKQLNTIKSKLPRIQIIEL